MRNRVLERRSFRRESSSGRYSQPIDRYYPETAGRLSSYSGMYVCICLSVCVSVPVIIIIIISSPINLRGARR